LLTFAEVILTNNLSFVNAIIMPKYEAPPAAKGSGLAQAYKVVPWHKDDLELCC
jgi:hypothetical protein